MNAAWVAQTDTELQCTKCMQMKPDADFQTDGKAAKHRFRFYWCRACVKAYNALHRKKVAA